MIHYASPQFWALYRALPAPIRDLADKNYALLKANPRHPSLRLKKIEDLWAVRVGAHYRALGVDVPDGIYWIWIGTHADYDTFIASPEVGLHPKVVHTSPGRAHGQRRCQGRI